MKQKLLTIFMSMLLIGASYAQERTITGRVTDADDGSALPGVTVMVQGTSIGTQTGGMESTPCLFRLPQLL